MHKFYLLTALIGWSFIASLQNTNYTAATNAPDNYDTLTEIDNYLAKLSADKGFSGGLLIVKNGVKVFGKGYGWADKENKIPFTTGTLASMGSITKAFTAAAIMKLAEQQKLSVTDPLNKFFPSIPSDKANITIQQLLTHSSGFHEFLQNDGGDYEKVEKEMFLKRAFAEPLAFQPGTKAVYTNIGMSVLAIIIEQVSGMEYEQYLRKNLFEPAGIKGIGYHFPKEKTDTIAIGYQNGKPWGTHQQHFADAGGGPFWNLKGNGGLEASVNDMLIWINSITRHSILSEASTKAMFTPQVQEDGYNGKSFFGYGCNISLSRRNTKMIDNGGSNGIYFARLVRLPEEGLVFYMVTNESTVNTNMVLPNVTQLYFTGNIAEDAMSMQRKFESPQSKRIYDIVMMPSTTDLSKELEKQKITVDDDMVLLDAGEVLIKEQHFEKALLLYRYYTTNFPKIVVAWNDMGDIYQSLGNKEEAIKCYKNALALRPGNPRAMENLKKLTN